MTHHPPLASLAGLYPFSFAQVQPLAGGHFSHVYECTDNNQTYIIRITPPNPDVDLRSMRATVEWLAFLSANGGPVSRPVPSQHGNLIEAMPSEDQTYIVSVFEKAPGVLAEGMLPTDWSDELFQSLGRAVGECHRLAKGYVPARAEFRRPEWDDAGNCFNPRESLPDADPLILERRARVLAHLQSLPKDGDSYGLAHLDLHFGNFFIDRAQRRIFLFDFDDCAYGWYMMDIAMLLFDVLVVYADADRLSFGARFLEQVLRGYHTQMELSGFWVSQLPHFLKLLEIGIYAMLYHGYDPATADEWVRTFMRERRHRIEHELPYVDLDFAAVYSKITL